MTTSVVCIGYATLDTILVTSEHPPEDGRVVASEHVVAGGGPAATAAVALSRLGVPCAFVGSVGDDAAGAQIVAGLVEEGVDVSGITTLPGKRSPQSTILVRGDARTIVHYPGTAAAALSNAAHALLADAEWIHADEVGYRHAPRDGRLSLDGGNHVSGLDLQGVRLYAPPLARLQEQFGDGHGARAAGAELVVATRGAAGSIAYLPNGTVIESTGFRVDVVSTLGAGDVFHGALLAGLTRGESVEAAMTFADRCASLSCRALDARSAIPHWEEEIVS